MVKRVWLKKTDPKFHKDPKEKDLVEAAEISLDPKEKDLVEAERISHGSEGEGYG